MVPKFLENFEVRITKLEKISLPGGEVSFRAHGLTRGKQEIQLELDGDAGLKAHETYVFPNIYEKPRANGSIAYEWQECDGLPVKQASKTEKVLAFRPKKKSNFPFNR